MHVSVVIPTRNRPDLIGNSVRAVLANDYPSFDVTVIDQSDDARTGDVVRTLMAHDQRLRYVHTDIAGLSRAYNIGVQETRGEPIAFTDDDCVAPPNWIHSIVSAFTSAPDAEMLYGQVLMPRSLEGTSDWIPTLTFDTERRLSATHGFEIFGMGANFAVRRSLFERIGGFDEVLGGGGPLRSSQDFDFQYRAYRGGATILLTPSVMVDHYGVRSTEQQPSTMRAYGFGDGAFYFKHVRCGDVYALSLLARRVARIVVRETLSLVGLRSRGLMSTYLWSCFAGIRESLRFPVDRARRLYGLPSSI